MCIILMIASVREYANACACTQIFLHGLEYDPRLSMLHAEKWEGLVSRVTCVTQCIERPTNDQVHQRSLAYDQDVYMFTLECSMMILLVHKSPDTNLAQR